MDKFCGGELFEIKPLEQTVDFSKEYAKLKMTPEQKGQINALIQQLPAMTAAGVLEKAYVVTFPDGLHHSLTPLKQGGFGSMYREGGKFAGTASLQSVSEAAVILNAFSAMSIATGQYFLTQINSELKMMRLSLDKILEFLYGDKKAELMAEMSFVKYAYQNFSSIMSQADQRIATIGSLQAAKKVAMKDIEFYMGDLDSLVNSKESDIVAMVDKAFQIKESLELSIQLYCMSSILEINYAQNYDRNYIRYLEGELLVYIDKCDKRMLSSFSALKIHIANLKGKLFGKINKEAIEEKVQETIDLLNNGEESSMRKSMRSALHSAEQKNEYYLTNDGTVYMKAV